MKKTKSVSYFSPLHFSLWLVLLAVMMIEAKYLNIKNLNRPVKTGNGILSGGGRIFVSDVAGEIQIGDGLCDKAIIQFLRLVYLVASGIASGVEMADPLEVVADVTHDVAVHDLRVVDVIKNLHPRGVDAGHDIYAPGDVIEH